MKIALAVTGLFLSTSFLAAQCPRGTSYGGGDDFVANGGVGIPLGFAFPLDGATYTHVHPSSNGFVFLSDGAQPITNSDYQASMSVFASGAPRIAVMWSDLDLMTTYDGELFVDVTVGQCEVVWHNAVNFAQTTPFSMSLTLYASGDAQVSYGPAAYNRSEAIVGISPGNGALTGNAIDVSSSPVSFDEVLYEQFAAFGGFDLAGSLSLLTTLTPGYATTFVPGAAPPCASSERYGVGCGPNAAGDIAWELMPVGGWDLTGAVTFARGVDRYTIFATPGGGYVAPSATAAVVSSIDDGYGTVELSAPMPTVGGETMFLTIATNGYVSLSAQQPEPGNSDYAPSLQDLQLFTEPTICGPWYDWSPNAGGRVVFEEIAGVAYVTFEDVPPYGATIGDTFQYQFDVQSGDCTIVYESMTMQSAAVWHTPLFGYTTGAQAYVATQYDFSADLAQPIVALDPVIELSLGGTVPVIGGTFEMVTSNIDPASPLSFLMFSDARLDPGVPMSVYGYDAPGCSVYLDSLLGSIAANNVDGTSVVRWTLPVSAPYFLGMPVATQSVCLTTSNGAGMLTSNGFEGVVGW